MEILRFITAGSVDDGKSTLTGRLLHDTQNIAGDVLTALTASDTGTINLAHLTDGLRAERQLGITIDVAYKYFATAKRKYILTDAPGHYNYLKNLVTGASNADVIILLIDASQGVTNQTMRHTLVAAFLHIPRVIVAVNKMDLIGYSSEVYEKLLSEFMTRTLALKLQNIAFVPVSALTGDNVCTPSEKMMWYNGPTLFEMLEVEPLRESKAGGPCVSVQNEIQCANGEQGFGGRVVSGIFMKGDGVRIYPRGIDAEVQKIMCGYEEVAEAAAGKNVCIFFNGDLRASRGDVVAPSTYTPRINEHIEADVCWLDGDNPLAAGRKYLLRIATREVECHVENVIYKINPVTYVREGGHTVSVNEFARIVIYPHAAVCYENFDANSEMGRGVLIDPVTNTTSGALIMV